MKIRVAENLIVSRSQVSWFRRKDFLLLTVGLSTYSSDDRFLVEHTRHLGNWALRIKNARKDDEGIYECQLSTHVSLLSICDLLRTSNDLPRLFS